MNHCTDCSAIEDAMSATTEALEYSRRRFANDGLASYNHDEAIRLGKRADQLQDAAPVNNHHTIWYTSKHDDPAMMEDDPDAFYAVKEHKSDRASKESIFKASPLEFWADHIEWCT